MDAKKFGAFIAGVRKENNMTQADLAKKILVTDKAVSRWERGLGVPDINTIAPLAAALGVSVAEIMQSERMEKDESSTGTTNVVLTDLCEPASRQRKDERKKRTASVRSSHTCYVCHFAYR